jgi:hypothetical protein
MAFCMAWSTQMSSGDVRALRASQLVRDASGAVFFAAREKGRRRALSDRTVAPLEALQLGIELHGKACIFRNRSGLPYSGDARG